MDTLQLLPIVMEIYLYDALLLKFFSQALEERLRWHGEGITSLQHGILMNLMAGAMTVSELGQRLGHDPSTMVRTVDVLEQKGLAQRHRDPNDRRRNPITITERGLELVLAVPTVSPDDPTFQALQAQGMESVVSLRNLLRDVLLEFPEGRFMLSQTAGIEGPPPADDPSTI